MLDAERDADDDDLAERLAISSSRIADLRAAINFLSPVVDGDGTPSERPEPDGEAAETAAEDPATDVSAPEESEE